jgi:hypothetical protein
LLQSEDHQQDGLQVAAEDQHSMEVQRAVVELAAVVTVNLVPLVVVV